MTSDYLKPESEEWYNETVDIANPDVNKSDIEVDIDSKLHESVYFKPEASTLRNEFIRDITKAHPMSKSEARKRLADLIDQSVKEARIDEVRKFRDDWGYSEEQIGDGSWEDYASYRINRLEKESKSD